MVSRQGVLMNKTSNKGVIINSDDDVRVVLRNFFGQAMEKQTFDAVLMPMKVPSGDSYAWILIKDRDFLSDANPIAPIMPINAAVALKKLTRKGSGKLNIAVVMRPCEIRAAIELTKLNQINLDKITLLSYDCAGALPMQDYIADPAKNEKIFNEIISDDIWNSKDVKPVCKICDKFSNPASDLHFAIFEKKIMLISNSEKGDKVFENLELKKEIELTEWGKKIENIKKKKLKNKDETFKIIKTMAEGFDNLQETFSHCIGCHNCGTVCPICYCRQCYFDSSVSKPNADFIMMRAKERGGLSLPLDRLMFHIGRMSHMSLSCVSCGLCTDACPVNIPVAKIFSYVASQTQATFDYKSGENAGDPLPMKDYRLDEIGELGKLVKKAEISESHNE